MTERYGALHVGATINRDQSPGSEMEILPVETVVSQAIGGSAPANSAIECAIESVAQSFPEALDTPLLLHLEQRSILAKFCLPHRASEPCEAPPEGAELQGEPTLAAAIE